MSDFKTENELFITFKSLIRKKILKCERVNDWCLRHGVEIIPEMHEIAPIEAFIFAYRVVDGMFPDEKGSTKTERVREVSERSNLGVSEDVLNLILKIGDRVPVSIDEDLVYLFPRDFYDKVLLFNMVPD